MAEKSLFKKKENLKIVLFRPSIIAGAKIQPFPGWTDTISAAGVISVMGGLGLISYINATGDNYFDIVPVDIVINSMLVATAYAP